MAVRFVPAGVLDIATDPTALPEQADGKMIISDAMTRCTNLHLDRGGMASTRRGSSKIKVDPLSQTGINRILEQAGDRYVFAGTEIYKNETAIGISLADELWSAILYSPFNIATQVVYALNGTNRKRIEGDTIYEWGIEAPTVAPTVGEPVCRVTQSWEINYGAKLGQDQQVYVDGHWEDAPAGGSLSGGTQQTYVPGYYKTVFAVGGSQSAANPATLWGYTQGNYQTSYHWETHFLLGEDVDDDTDIANMWGWEMMTGDGFTGDYNAKYTYVRKDGDTLVCESNPSPEAETTTHLSKTGLAVNWTASADTQVTHVRTYRTLTGGGNYYLDQEIAVGTTTAYSDIADTALGAEVSIDHDRPPLGTIVCGPLFSGICFIVKDNNLYYCLNQQPEYWPPLYYVEVAPPQFPIKAVTGLGGQLYIATAHEIYQLMGTGATSFFPLAMSAMTGTQGLDCFEAVKGHGIFHLGTDGLYQFTGGMDNKISDGNLRPLFEGTTTGSIPGINKNYLANCIMKHFEGKLYFGYPSADAVYPDNILVMDLVNKKVMHYQYNTELRTLTIDLANRRILAGDNDGYVWQIEQKTDTTDEGAAISWQVQSKDFTPFRKYFPRYARYDVNLNNGGSANGYVVMDGVSKQTHALIEDRQTRKRLITSCTGDRMAVRLSGSGSVDIYKVELE